ncbi:hypothetical protein BCR42DRAFT_236986 [Absidia repens]|uniref:Uncharacterized protein n=1 Tax=Absidia repens TaxID=90262 RepID=A0A1X2IJA0_9FUNG|nr:hypothetical protein BCR42DRAFT_236986 [Absidia repens]
MVDGFTSGLHDMKEDVFLGYLNSLKQQAPDNFLDFLMNYKPGNTTTGLDNMEMTCLQWIKKPWSHKLVWLLYVEIAICKYGWSPKLSEIGSKALAKYYDSFDISWQLISSTPYYATRNAETVKFLQKLANTSNSCPSGMLTSTSRKTTELLLRTLQHDGLYATLKLLIPHDSAERIAHFESHPLKRINLSLQSRPGYIKIDDANLYYLWICIIVFYLTRRLPHQYYASFWTDRLGKARIQKLTANQMLGIDWTSLRKEPLATEEQVVVASILLDLLKYFNSKIHGMKKGKEKDKQLGYFMSVVWTLMDFMKHLDYMTTQQL